jgi:hypothetical protein
MHDMLIGVFANMGAADRAALDLQRANFSAEHATSDQVPGVLELEQQGWTALMVNPAGREPEARAIMMRAGVERLINRDTEASPHSAMRVGSPDVDAYLQANPAPNVSGRDPGSPIPNKEGTTDGSKTAMVADADAQRSPMREINIQPGDAELDDKMRRGAERVI